MLSEKHTARRGSVQRGWRLSTACRTRALQKGTSRIGVQFPLTLQEARPLSKTRN